MTNGSPAAFVAMAFSYNLLAVRANASAAVHVVAVRVNDGHRARAGRLDELHVRRGKVADSRFFVKERLREDSNQRLIVEVVVFGNDVWRRVATQVSRCVNNAVRSGREYKDEEGKKKPVCGERQGGLGGMAAVHMDGYSGRRGMAAGGGRREEEEGSGQPPSVCAMIRAQNSLKV